MHQVALIYNTNAIPEGFQTDDQKRMNEMKETENETENRINEAENNQIEESESKNENPFNLIREESQESQKSPNLLTKSDLQEPEALYNNSEELENDRSPDVRRQFLHLGNTYLKIMILK